jgi:hypothetical protein
LTENVEKTVAVCGETANPQESGFAALPPTTQSIAFGRQPRHIRAEFLVLGSGTVPVVQRVTGEVVRSHGNGGKRPRHI